MSHIKRCSNEVMDQGVRILNDSGGVIISSTKVGYIIMTSDKVGLDRKFEAKQRNFNKPAVVLCSSMEHLKTLAELNPDIEKFYQYHWDNDIFLGCILPWQEDALFYIPDDGSDELMMDQRKTSCFVIKFGIPSEQITKRLWDRYKKLIFASSANPSGQPNRGLLSGIGKKIEKSVDLLIEVDDYVDSIQSDVNEESLYEQGVIVSMVGPHGALIPQQKNRREIFPCPTLIRKGLDVDRIMLSLTCHFNTWDYRQGTYY
jgi:tRNA A37 threonylcarbamoyladenosine synthetase subunit TsaC/SUA5/YrdC